MAVQDHRLVWTVWVYEGTQHNKQNGLTGWRFRTIVSSGLSLGVREASPPSKKRVLSVISEQSGSETVYSRATVIRTYQVSLGYLMILGFPWFSWSF